MQTKPRETESSDVGESLMIFELRAPVHEPWARAQQGLSRKLAAPGRAPRIDGHICTQERTERRNHEVLLGKERASESWEGKAHPRRTMSLGCFHFLFLCSSVCVMCMC